MKDITSNLIDAVTSSLAGNPEQRRNVIVNIEKSKEEFKETENKKKPSYLKYLKQDEDIVDVYKTIKNKKLSNNQIKEKLRNFLKDPEKLKNFLESILNSNTTKKEESKEAMGAASAGGYSAPLFSTTKGDIVKGVKTVREEIEEDEDIKKVETKEATTSASSGQYSSPAIWAKSLNKKDFRGYSKPLYKGGKFVQVKKKCKKFPYCNQGDINALKIFENQSVQNAIESVSKTYNLDKEFISEIIYQEIRKTKR
jgi:hypothetical protein